MSFTCPKCGRTSHNPNDEKEGYCGACHEWTGITGGLTDAELKKLADEAEIGYDVHTIVPRPIKRHE